MTKFDSYELSDQIFAVRGSAMALVEARNEIMRKFLDETDTDYLWMIDTDMGFKPNTIDNLLAAGHDVTGALCYGQAEVTQDGMGGYKTQSFVVAYDMVQREDGFTHYVLADLNLEPEIDRKIHQVAATGTGCLLISRKAGLKVRDSFGDTWFHQVAYSTKDGTIMRISEDLSFCYRLSTVGIPVFVHTGVPTNHMKAVWLS